MRILIITDNGEKYEINIKKEICISVLEEPGEQLIEASRPYQTTNEYSIPREDLLEEEKKEEEEFGEEPMEEPIPEEPEEETTEEEETKEEQITEEKEEEKEGEEPSIDKYTKEKLAELIKKITPA